MAKLYFKIASDWEEVVRLRNEIAKLKQELKGMDSTQSPAAFKSLNTQLSASTQRMDELVTKAAHAGAVMEGDFRKKIFDASQTVNGFTEKIIAQKNTIKSFEQDLRRVQEAWSHAVKNGQSTKGLENPIRLKKVILEEKDALFNLTQEQANARLSVKKLRDEYALYKNDGKNVVATNEAMVISWKKALGVIGGVAALKRLGSEIIRVRGEFQSMQTAIETMVGKDMAGQLIPQIKELAKISPLTMSDMVGAEKMMLGFNIQAEDTIKYLKAISDISMGESGKFNSLTLAFSQMSAAGKLMGQDLNQMINAGFNPLQVIAEKTGKSIATLKDEMSKGAISAEMVQQAFIDATSAGGKFFGMSENASKTINGQISMMQDALDNAFNEMGQKSEGVIMKGIQMTTSLIENYETVGKVLVGLIATYGAYRTALVLNIALEKAQAVQRLASIKGITTMKMLTDMLTGSVTKLNVALAGKGFAMIGGAAVASSLLLLDWANEQDKCTKAVEKFNKEQNAAMETEKNRKQAIEAAISVASDEKKSTKERADAIGVLKQMYKSIIPEYDKETFLLKNILDYKNKVNEADERNARIGYKTKLVMLDRDIAKYEAGLKEANKQGAGQATQGIMNTLNNLKKERELYSNLLNDIEKEQITTKTTPKSEIKNKSYWEKQKKDAESILESIASSQKQLMDAGIFKGIDAATVKSYKDNVKQLKEAEKELKIYDSSSKQNNEVDKLRQQQQKSSEELLALRRQNQQDEIDLMGEGRKKMLQQIDADFEARKAEITKKAHELAEVNKKAGLSGLNSNGLTSEQQAEIDKANKLNAQFRAKAESDMYKVEAEAMRNYLKEYGTFQQQKLAIAEEYAEKIRKAQNEGERLTLEKQKDAALQQVEIKAIKQSVDWGSVFGEFGAMFKDQLQPTIDKLKSIAQSDEFKSSSLQDQQTLYELISKLEQSNAAWDSDIFQKVSDDMTAYQTAMQNHLKAQERERQATEVLARAKRDLAAAEQSGNGTDALNAQAKVTEAQLALNAAARDVQDFGTQVQETTSDLQASSTQAVNMFQNLESGLKGLTSGSLQGVGQGLMQLDKLFNKGGITKDVGNALASGFQSLLGKDSKASKTISEALGSAGMAGEIISGVLGILDLLKDGFSNIFVSLQDTVFGAVEGILNDVFSGDIIVKPLENSVKHVGTILDTITFGGFSNWLGTGDSDKNLERDIEYLAQSNQDLKNSLDNLSEKMVKASVADASDIYGVQKENILKQEANTRESMQRSASASSNGFLGIGGSHSTNYKINKGMSSSEWKRVSEIVGRSVQNASQFFQLSSEQMAKLAEEDTTLYSKIKSLADDGYKNAAQFMDEYITYYKQLEELENAYNEKLTNTSFDSVRSDFKNVLLDMESDAEDFADNFEKMMQNAIVESLMTKKYDKLIQAWYEEFAKAMEGDEKIDEYEQRKLQDRWNSIMNQALAERDALKDAMGWESDSESSREATAKGIATASQDSVDENNGRLTVIQGHTYGINERVDRIATGIDTIASHTVNLTCLTNIDKTMQSLLTMRNEAIAHLADIANYTSNLVEIKEFMHSMKAGIDTLNTKGITLKR